MAVGNVSAALAKLGRRVAVIDLDFEAPGLRHVLGAERTPQFKKGYGIQHYLKGEIDLQIMDEHVCIDVFGPEGPLTHFAVPPEAVLLYIMASPKVAQVDAKEPKVVKLMR